MFLGYSRLTLYTKLRPEECRLRLERLLAPAFALSPRRERPITGRVSNEGFSIKRFISYRNGFQTAAVGRFKQNDQGTVVSLCLGVTREARTFAFAWLMIAVLLIIVPLVLISINMYLTSTAHLDSLTAVILVGSVFVVIWCVVVGFGRWLARGEASYLLDFLKSTLDAEGG